MEGKMIPHNNDNGNNLQAHPSEIKLGKYEHYKGNFYEVIGVVLHTETNEKLVLYRALYDSDKQKDESNHSVFFVRPYNMFFEKVLVNGKKVDRFKYIGECQPKERGKIKVA